MELSPVRVKFGGVDLGGSLGNVVISTKFMKAPIMADQSGKTVRDRRVSGIEITLTTELAQIKDKDIWKVVFPHAKEVVSGPNKAMYFEGAIGDSDLAHAAELLLHPLSLADADLSGDHKFYKACASAESEITYGPEEQARLKIVWNILPDDSTVPDRFYFHGDPAVGLVPASAGAPIQSGTGNGTLTAVAVFNGATKTETITAKVIAVPGVDEAIFEVTGSVSGFLGNVSLPGTPLGSVNFVSGPIAFTLTDGSTDFVVNDQFTIATVASNYA
jgi:hypothetical protein